MKIRITSRKQVWKGTAIIAIPSVIFSNLLTYLFEIWLMPPFYLSDLTVSTLASGIVAPLVAYILFDQAYAIHLLNDELYGEVEARKTAESDLVRKNRQLREANQAAVAARRAAESANQAKSIFLANMSHELRTPLNAILGFSELMRGNARLPEEERENLGIIHRSGEHLLSLINQVLDLSKIEAGKTVLNPTDSDLLRLLDDITDLFRLRAEEKGLYLISDRAPDLPQHIRADEMKLRQVLINLLNNAVKFTTEGRIFLRIGLRECENSAFALRFEVEDTGPGIAPDEISRLFQPFVQTRMGQTAREGTGLGLVISREFAQLMGGDISVRSQIGKGTVFSFHIQAEAGNATIRSERSQSRVIALEPGQPRYRILVVDDKADNRQLLLKMLAPFGFDLREAEDGAKAVAMWKKWHPHLIWMDIRMPETDGYEATRRIRAADSDGETKIIAVTASVFEEERAEILATGCDDFLRKPFRESDVFDMMHRHIGVRYVYEEDALRETGDDLTVAEPAAFSNIPSALLAQIAQAAACADMEETKKRIREVRDHDRALADLLSGLANNFEYEKIRSLLSGTDQEEAVSAPAIRSSADPKKRAELLTILENEFSDRWKGVGKRMIFDEICAFGESVEALGNAYDEPVLADWGRIVSHQARTFDVGELRETLAEFPELIKKLKSDEPK